MTIQCEIVEGAAQATSETPATDVVVVSAANGRGAGSVALGSTLATLVGTANGIEQVVIDSYAIVVGAGLAESTLSHTMVVAEVLSSIGKGRSALLASFNELALATAQAAATVADDQAPLLLIAAARASADVTADTIATYTLTGTARAKSSTVGLGLLETITSTADAAATILILRRATEIVASNADGVSEAYPSSVPRDLLLISTGNTASLIEMQVGQTLIVETAVSAASSVWYKDPSRVAWVMNTETTAMNWYENFDFESITQPPGKVLAAGPTGVYELTGNTDAGEQIDAKVVSGFMDFGTPQTKRMDVMNFGYTSTGRISIVPETYGSGPPPVTYFLEQRAAAAPRNSRVIPGKGLVGRYWRVTFRNEDGAEFEIHDASVDLAVSPRKM